MLAVFSLFCRALSVARGLDRPGPMRADRRQPHAARRLEAGAGTSGRARPAGARLEQEKKL